MFIRGGYNVYPLEVESVLSTHPKVAEVAVAPRPDEVMGEIGVAVVVPADPGDPPTLDELRAHGEQGLAAYKLPEAVRLVVALPTNATDKVDRKALVAGERAEFGGDGGAADRPAPPASVARIGSRAVRGLERRPCGDGALPGSVGTRAVRRARRP